MIKKLRSPGWASERTLLGYGSFFGLLLGLGFAILAVKFLDPSRCINKFLFTCIKWVAIGTNIDAHIFYCGKKFNFISTSALYFCFEIIWMNICLHTIPFCYEFIVDINSAFVSVSFILARRRSIVS